MSAYENKLKPVYEYVISCFHKFPQIVFQTVSRVFMSVDRFKWVNPNSPSVIHSILVWRGWLFTQFVWLMLLLLWIIWLKIQFVA